MTTTATKTTATLQKLDEFLQTGDAFLLKLPHKLKACYFDDDGKSLFESAQSEEFGTITCPDDLKDTDETQGNLTAKPAT